MSCVRVRARACKCGVYDGCDKYCTNFKRQKCPRDINYSAGNLCVTELQETME